MSTTQKTHLLLIVDLIDELGVNPHYIVSSIGNGEWSTMAAHVSAEDLQKVAAAKAIEPVEHVTDDHTWEAVAFNVGKTMVSFTHSTRG